MESLPNLSGKISLLNYQKIRLMYTSLKGMSGRHIRRLPFLTFSRRMPIESMGIEAFMEELASTAEEEIKQMEDVRNKSCLE